MTKITLHKIKITSKCIFKFVLWIFFTRIFFLILFTIPDFQIQNKVILEI